MAQRQSTDQHQPSLPAALVLALDKEFGFLPIPRWLRYHPEKPPHFGLLLNAVFGFGGTFLVANLYYCQPLLSSVNLPLPQVDTKIQFSQSFDVSYGEVSRIPTLIQGGYAAGLFLISPLGDLVRRRQLVLLLIVLSTGLTIGLAITNSLVTFEVLSFLVGLLSVVPPIFVALAADLAPPHRRATAISVVLSGLLFGILVARVISGVIAQFTSWRVVYYTAIGTQAFVLLACYLLIPDYPAKNAGLTYWDIMFSMVKLAVTEPVLVQATIITIGSSACFSSFWVTLTFLLGSPPYNYSTLVIGLFGLIGIFAVALSPLVGRLVDKLVPWYGVLVSLILLLCTQAIQTGAGGLNVAAVIITTIGLDLFRQLTQVSLTAAVFDISAAARSRLNAILIVAFFIGSVMGTSVGTKVFVEHGWRAASALNMAWYGFQLAVLLLRGPHCGRYTWFGYQGGLEGRKSVVNHAEKEAPGVTSSDIAKDVETGTDKDIALESSEK